MKARKKAPKIVISGYYGFGNCGDEAVLLAMIRSLRALIPDIKIVVLSANPKQTQEFYGVKAVNRWNPLIVFLEILTCRLFISGGGSLLQDATGPNSVIYYLGVIRIALLLRKKVMIYSQGIGPLYDKKGRARVAKVFNRCHGITIRDGRSAELLVELGVEKEIQVVCDPVMSLCENDADKALITSDLVEAGLPTGKHAEQKKLLLVIMRPWGDNNHIKPVAEPLDAQISNGWEVLLIPAHYSEDSDIITQITAMMKHEPFSLNKNLTPDRFLALISHADKVFSMRLHGLICAMTVSTPMLALSYNPKVDAFMRQVQMEKYCLPLDGFDIKTATPLLEHLDTLSPQKLQQLETLRAELQTLASKPAQIAVDLLN